MEPRKIFIKTRDIYEVELQGQGTCFVQAEADACFIPYTLAIAAEKEKAELVKALETVAPAINQLVDAISQADFIRNPRLVAECTEAVREALHNHAQGPNASRADSGAGESDEGA